LLIDLSYWNCVVLVIDHWVKKMILSNDLDYWIVNPVDRVSCKLEHENLLSASFVVFCWDRKHSCDIFSLIPIIILLSMPKCHCWCKCLYWMTLYAANLVWWTWNLGHSWGFCCKVERKLFVLLLLCVCTDYWGCIRDF